MPIPTRNKGEKKKAFIARCMGNEVMLKEYPKQEQRAAICYSQSKKTKRGDESVSEQFVYETEEIIDKLDEV